MKYLRKSSGLGLASPFLIILGLLTIVSFILPLRPTQSQMEKRNLAEFPDFSWETLVSGSYFDDITLWFSDTFPGRESWLQLSSSISSFHGYSEITFTSDIDLNQNSPSVPSPLEDPAYSTEPSSEASPMPQTDASAPTESQVDAATDPTGEAELEEAEAAEIELGDGALIQIGDAVFNQAGFSALYSDKYADSVSRLADAVAEQGIRVISAPAPTSVGIMVDSQYLEKLNCADQNAVIQYIHSKMSDNVITVDTYSAVSAHKDEYIYFRTDHHWTALGAYYAYAATCEAAGYTPASLSDFTVWDQGEFEGSLYWRAPNPRKLRLDQVDAYIPQGDIEVVVHDAQGNSRSSQLLFDTTQRETNTKYLTFLGTDYPMTEITNNSLPDGPTCIIVKDSFGNAISPFYTQNYHKIYAIDYRKYSVALKWFAQAHDVDDIIFAPYLIATQAVDGNNLFSALCN